MAQDKKVSNKNFKVILKIANIRETNVFLYEHSVITRNYAITYYQTLDEVLWSFSLKKPKNGKNFQITEKSCNFNQNFAKNCDIKMMKTIPWPIKNFQNHIAKTRRFFGHWGRKNLNNDNKFQKIAKKIARFVNKLPQIWDIKKLKIIL